MSRTPLRNAPVNRRSGNERSKFTGTCYVEAMTKPPNTSTTPALREVVIFSIVGVGYIYAVWLALEGRFFPACASIMASLLAAAWVARGWRLNRLRPPVEPRQPLGLLASGYRPMRNRTLHLSHHQPSAMPPHTDVPSYEQAPGGTGSPHLAHASQTGDPSP